MRPYSHNGRGGRRRVYETCPNGRVWRQWTGNASGLEKASALSGSNIWALGGTLTPFTTVMHFNGRSWRPVTAKALSGLSFGGIRAFSRSDIWVTAIVATSNQPAFLVHFNGTQWARFELPWKADVDSIAADGHGGLWMNALELTNQAFVVHRTAAGQWSRTPTSRFLFDLAHIPGTASLRGVGFAATRTGANAVIWAYGTV